MKELIVYNSLAKSLATNYGSDIKLTRTFKLAGGDINKAYGIELSNGIDVFMKANEKQNVDFFIQEVNNLEAISKTKTISTPEVIAYGTDDGDNVGYSFLLLKYVPEENQTKEFWQNLGRKVAQMHNAKTSEFLSKEDLDKENKFGFSQDNYIGRNKQINSAKKTWIDFFRENRLEVQFKLAQNYFSENDFSKITKLLDNLEKFLPEPNQTSLLHGDLWKGNILCAKNFEPYLIDPACYVGHNETDIAMTELFGAFPNDFYSAYNEIKPIDSEYSNRRDLYNLYHVLNHLNLFGQTYLEAAKAIIDKYVE